MRLHATRWRWLVGVLVAALTSLYPAQIAHAQTPLPSVRIGAPSLISPSAANTYFGSSTTSTNGLGASGRPPEIVELTRTLRNDADLIYDYVRNNVEIEWSYGLQKGALGAVLDHSGTAFDQAHLMVELLREAGYTASYVEGTITLSGAQFQQWSGITSARAACQLLAAGGIGASINGATTADCSYGAASVSTITLSHIWVSVTISGTAYLFDPSYKPHDFVSGINLNSTAGLTTGQALSDASTGMQSGTNSGVTYARDLDADALNSRLETYGANLLSHINTNHSARLEDIVGGATITRYETPSSGLRQTSLPYSSATQHTWSGNIPNQYRTTLRVEVYKDFVDLTQPGNRRRDLIMDRDLYVDEIYGRKLVVIPNYPVGIGSQEADFNVSLRLTNEAVMSPIVLDSFSFEDDLAYLRDGAIELSANHPYPAAQSGAAQTDGDYMDASVERSVYMFLPLTIVHGWGRAGEGLAESWGTRLDTPIPPVEYEGTCEPCDSYYYSSMGDGRREQLAVNWLVQASRAAELNAEIADSIYTHHHSLGVVTADVWNPAVAIGVGMVHDYYYVVQDSFDRVDVASGFSLTSTTADATTRRAAIHSIAATIEALEGNVAVEAADLVDTTSTANRFAWGNAPPGSEDLSGGYGPRRFYRYNSGNASNAYNLSVAEGATSTANDGIVPNQSTEPELTTAQMSTRRQNLADAIGEYAAAGFDIVASEEAFLGPGQRGGPSRHIQQPFGYAHAPSQQRGGAFVATRYVGGDPVEIAHIVSGHDEDAKGGGGGAQANQQALYDPSVAADVLRSRFVDRSRSVGVDLENGAVTYAPPSELRVGNGDFPYSLSANMVWRGGNQTSELFGPTVHTQPQTPWTSNWQNTLTISSSAAETMGESDIRGAAAAIAAILAMQDIYRSSVSSQRESAALLAAAWWMREITGNVVTVNVGADTRQFVRNVSGQYFAPGAAAYATLAQTGSRTPMIEQCFQPLWTHVRGWNQSGMSFQVTNANGDQQNFAFWENEYRTGAGAAVCGAMRGFRLTSWTFPQGVTVNLTYTSPGSGALDRLTEVSNSLGRSIGLNYNLSGVLTGFDNNLSSGDARATSFATVGLGSATTTFTDAAGAQTRVAHGITSQRHRLTDVFDANDTTTPSLRYTYDSLHRVKEAQDAVALQATRDPYEFRIARRVRGEREDPLGGRYTVLFDEDGRVFRHIDELGRVSNLSHDGRGRATRTIFPELDEERLVYDARNRVTELRRVAKPSSGLSDIVIGATWNDTWNKPATITDARGYRTDFAYIASGNGAGQLSTATRPAPSGGTPIGSGTRPGYTFTYGSFGRVATTADPTGLVVSNAYNATNGNLNSTTLDPSGLNAATSFTYDAQGDQLTSTDPRGNATSTSYDAMRRPTLVRNHNGNSAAALLAAQRTNYNTLGQVTSVEGGTAFSGTSVTAWLTRESRTYTPTGQVATVTNGTSNTTTNAYDGLDRLLSVTDPVSRVTRNEYDAAGQLIRIMRAYGSALQQDYARYTYTANGQRASVRDANNNRSEYSYDGFDRLSRLTFPSTTLGANAVNASDYEQYGYDANGNRTSLRLRSGESISYSFDNLNRESVKDIPGGTATDVYSTYDLAGRRLSALFTSTSGQGIVYDYDTAGRLESETSTIGTSRALAFQYDVGSNRTRITWPDASYVTYTYDAMNRVDLVRESGSTTLADYAYDNLGRRGTLTRGDGSVSTFSYDNASRLTGLAHNLAGSANDQTYGFAFTAASQINQRTASNDSYNWTSANDTIAYVRDGLNRYTSVDNVGFSYDARQNLINDGTRRFCYDLENHLTAVAPAATDPCTTPSTLALGYDPLGRLRQTTAASASTYFLYDGDRLVAEYNGAGTVLRRYVHGPGVDEPLVWYEGAALTDRRHLITDHQGTVVAASGSTTTLYPYGPYGEPASWTGSRFRYTGQVALPEAQLYHYKARVYDPVLGRFLQTDPVGYEDDLNLYAYVRSDPINSTDPTGRQSCREPPCPDIPRPDRAVRDASAQAVGPASRSGGAERGANTFVNPQTGQARTVTGAAAGRGTTREFQHRVPPDNPTSRATVLTHTHNASGERGVRAVQETRRNNAPSEADQSALNSRGVAIQVIGPAVTGTLYRMDSQDYFSVESGDVAAVPNLESQQIIVEDERAPE